MLVVNLLILINNTKFTLLQKKSKVLLSAQAGADWEKGGKGSFIEPISINTFFTLEGFSFTTRYLNKLLL